MNFTSLFFVADYNYNPLECSLVDVAHHGNAPVKSSVLILLEQTHSSMVS